MALTATSNPIPPLGSNLMPPLGLIIGVTVLGVVLLLGAVIGVSVFIRRRRPEVEANHVDNASSPPQSRPQATAIRSMREVGVTRPAHSKRAAPLPVALPGTEGAISAATPVSSKSPPSVPPLPPTRDVTQPSVPSTPPIPQTTSPGMRVAPILAVDLSSTSHPAITSTEIHPLTAQNPRAATLGPNAAALYCEIEDLREQVRLLQLRDGARLSDSEFESYEPPPEYSLRDPGSGGEDAR